ncbi:hypothetical protein [Magnetofaba australis]|uniref:Phage coat protein n=1 Tax=Magnetofaba australis IT-1 TaxID=1434232 RepID=A0A1Y2KAR5_9PROT|nr:hypothetical protein [Magnetofaba australis]OSM07024.1 hypothetical protein MAIT1_00071 [Magnetofaba australis IT-1]
MKKIFDRKGKVAGIGLGMLSAFMAAPAMAAESAWVTAFKSGELVQLSEDITAAGVAMLGLIAAVATIRFVIIAIRGVK